MSDNPIKLGVAPVCSPWGSFDVIVVPDDDEAALKAGIPEDVLPLATQEHSVMDGRRMFIRETLLTRLKAEFSALGQRH